MALISPTHLLISTRPLQLRQSGIESSGTQYRGKFWVSSTSLVLRPQSWKFNSKEQGNYGLARNCILFRNLFTCYSSASSINSPGWFSSGAFPSIAFPASDCTNDNSGLPLGKVDSCLMELNWVNWLVRLLHKSARSFSVSIKSCELTGSNPELAKAWIGVDVHAWHKHIAYQAAVYALLKTVIDAGFLLSEEHCNDPSPVHDILSPKIKVLQEFIESQLHTRDAQLVKWFKLVELPHLAGLFVPLFKRWSAKCTRSDVAVVILAISCCLAVEKLGAEHISCPMFTVSIQDLVEELLNVSHDLVSMDILHSLAFEAGFEQEFLAHFGSKVLHNKTNQGIEFLIGLVQKKLSVAFHRESVISSMKAFHSTKIQDKNLATLGLFAFLGRRTRLFLSGMGIKDLDEQVEDFLSYLECGCLFIYPELSSLSLYQLFMEVVSEEIGWLDFYPAVPYGSHQEKRRSKQHARQAEKEIILCTVFTVCSDVFSGFAHFGNSTQQPLDADLVPFFLRSQNLLSICQEDYWAAYVRSVEPLKTAESGISEPMMSLGNKSTSHEPISLKEVQKKPAASMIKDIKECTFQHGSQLSEFTSLDGINAVTLVKQASAEAKPKRKSLLRISRDRLKSASSDLCMGTQLLFIDISVARVLVLKQICGHKLTQRESKKLAKTMTDIACVIPVTILMLLPLSAVGHAAILAAIKKYIPCLIPSPYSSERLNIMKQLNRTKRMEVKSWMNLEDVSSMVF